MVRVLRTVLYGGRPACFLDINQGQILQDLPLPGQLLQEVMLENPGHIRGGQFLQYKVLIWLMHLGLIRICLYICILGR